MAPGSPGCNAVGAAWSLARLATSSLAPTWLLGVRGQGAPALRHTGIRVDLEHPQHRLGAGGGAHLAHRLAEALAPALALIGGERRLLAAGRPEGQRPQP